MTVGNFLKHHHHQLAYSEPDQRENIHENVKKNTCVQKELNNNEREDLIGRCGASYILAF